MQIAPHPDVGEIARRAVTLVRGLPELDPLAAAAISFGGDVNALAHEAPSLATFSLDIDPADDAVSSVLDALARNGRRPLILARRAHLHGAQAAAIERIVQQYPDAWSFRCSSRSISGCSATRVICLRRMATNLFRSPVSPTCCSARISPAVCCRSQQARKVVAFPRMEQVMQGGLGVEFTGAAARIEHRGSVVFERAYGTTRGDRLARPVYCDTRFDLASLTKLFIATIALRLANERLVALDAPLGRVLTEWRGLPQEDITMRMLLAHNSGMDSGADYRAILDENVERFALRAPLLASPGDRVIYSDLGFIALGAALERIAQSSLPALVRRYFGSSPRFRPNARERAMIPATEEDVWRGRVQGFAHDEKAYLMGGAAGHAGLFGSALDVALMTGKYLRPAFSLARDASKNERPIPCCVADWMGAQNERCQLVRTLAGSYFIRAHRFRRDVRLGRSDARPPRRAGDEQRLLRSRSSRGECPESADCVLRGHGGRSGPAMIALGLMSGTSLDGIDVAVVRIVPSAQRYDLDLLHFETVPYAAALRDELLGALPPNAGSTAAIAHLHRALGSAFADAANDRRRC